MLTVVVAQRALLREGVAALLQHTNYKVIASASGASELKDLRVPPGRRTLVILGIDDADGNIAEAAENITVLRSLFSDSTIVVVAEIRSPINMQQILALVPDGYIANLGSRDILLKLLEFTLLNQQVIVLPQPIRSPILGDQTGSGKRVSWANNPVARDFQSSSALAINPHDPQFSQRERQVLHYLAEGSTNKEIARSCSITESTVKVHLKAILRKITAHNRTQAAIWAVARGYHALPGPPDQASNKTHGSDNRPTAPTPRSTR
jgi:two-component system nitrate/nitrite response regulator NarL